MPLNVINSIKAFNNKKKTLLLRKLNRIITVKALIKKSYNF